MIMQKTIKEWFNLLPEPYRQQAISNATNCTRTSYNLLSVVENIKEAIDKGFVWMYTPERSEYWGNLHNNPPQLIEPTPEFLIFN